MKHKFLIIKKQTIIAILLLFFVACGIFAAFFAVTSVSTSPKPTYTVVIDAGHGGKDGGSVGKTFCTLEKEINLTYAFCLKNILQQFGLGVVMTRTNDDGLYNELAKNKKRDDMQKRKQIIINSNADFVVSIHMNSFPDSSACGAETYFCKGSSSGEKLASKIQKNFHKNLPNAKSEPKSGEFFMLEQIPCPSVLVECGFLSNAKEEENLLKPEYMQELCYCIFLGILQYLD